jgi:rod shape-determining protein MreD
MRNLIALPLLGLAVILQSAVVSHVTLLSGYPDLVLILLAAWALQSQVDSAWQWAFLACILVGFMTRLPWPVVVLGYAGLVLLAQALRRRVWQAPLLAMFTVTFLGTLFMHILSFIALSLTGSSLSLGDVLGLVTLPTLLLNLLFAIPVYAFMRDLSRWVYPGEEVQ